MHMHLVETPYQKEYARRRTGSTAVQYLQQFGLLGEKMTLGHGVWLTDADIELLADTGTHICHCPSSNLRLRSGTAPLNRLAERRIGVAIGIDEAGINEDRDMLQEMRLALNLHRKPGMDNTVPKPCQVLRMATEDSAKTTPFDAEIGILEPGRAADLSLMRWEQIASPYLETEVPVVSALLHRAKPSCVDTVIVGGEPVYREGRFTRVDREAAMEVLAASLSGHRTTSGEQRYQIAREVSGHVETFYRGYLDKGNSH
jgi:cytosine/adenosine deaminase-related metal-dependent hydrolase